MTEAACDTQLAAFFIGESMGRLIVYVGIWLRNNSLRGGAAHFFSIPTLATPAIAI